MSSPLQGDGLINNKNDILHEQKKTQKNTNKNLPKFSKVDIDNLIDSDDENKIEKQKLDEKKQNINNSGYERPFIDTQSMLDSINRSFQPYQEAYTPFQGLLGDFGGVNQDDSDFGGNGGNYSGESDGPDRIEFDTSKDDQNNNNNNPNFSLPPHFDTPPLTAALKNLSSIYSSAINDNPPKHHKNYNKSAKNNKNYEINDENNDIDEGDDEDDDLDEDEQAILDQFDLSTKSGQFEAYQALTTYIMDKKNRIDPNRFGVTAVPVDVGGNGVKKTNHKNDAKNDAKNNLKNHLKNEKKKTKKEFPLFQWARVTPDGHIIKKVLEHGYPDRDDDDDDDDSDDNTKKNDKNNKTCRNIGINLPQNFVPKIDFFDPKNGIFSTNSNLEIEVPNLELPTLKSSNDIQVGTPNALTRAYGLLSIRVYDLSAVKKKGQQNDQNNPTIPSPDAVILTPTSSHEYDLSSLQPDLIYSSLNEEVGVLLGQNQSLTGLEVGISTMNVGERAIIMSSSKYGGKMEYLGHYQHFFSDKFIDNFCQNIFQIRGGKCEENCNFFGSRNDNSKNPPTFYAGTTPHLPPSNNPPTAEDISMGSLRTMLTYTTPLNLPQKITHSSQKPKTPHFPLKSTLTTPPYTIDRPQSLNSPPRFIPKLTQVAPVCELTKTLHIIHNITYQMIFVALKQHKLASLRHMASARDVLLYPVSTMVIPPFEGRLNSLSGGKGMQFLRFVAENDGNLRDNRDNGDNNGLRVNNGVNRQVGVNKDINRGYSINKGGNNGTLAVETNNYGEVLDRDDVGEMGTEFIDVNHFGIFGGKNDEKNDKNLEPFHWFDIHDSEDITIPLVNDKYYQDIICSSPGVSSHVQKLIKNYTFEKNEKNEKNQNNPQKNITKDQIVDSLLKKHQKTTLPTTQSPHNPHISLQNRKNEENHEKTQQTQPHQAGSSGFGLTNGNYILEFDFTLTRFEKEPNLHTMERDEKLIFIQKRRFLAKLLYQNFSKFQSSIVQYTKAVTVVEDDYISEHQANNANASPDPENDFKLGKNKAKSDTAPAINGIKQQILPQLTPNERKHLSILLYGNIIQSYWQISYYLQKFNAILFYISIILGKFQDSYNVKALWYKYRTLWYLDDMYQAHHNIKLCIVKCDELLGIYHSGRFRNQDFLKKQEEMSGLFSDFGKDSGFGSHNKNEERSEQNEQNEQNQQSEQNNNQNEQNDPQNKPKPLTIDYNNFSRYRDIITLQPKLEKENKIFLKMLQQQELRQNSKMKGFLLPSHYNKGKSDNNEGGDDDFNNNGVHFDDTKTDTKNPKKTGVGFLSEEYTTINKLTGETEISLGLYDDKPFIAESSSYSNKSWKANNRCEGLMNGLRLVGIVLYSQATQSWNRCYERYFAKEWAYKGKKRR